MLFCCCADVPDKKAAIISVQSPLEDLSPALAELEAQVEAPVSAPSFTAVVTKPSEAAPLGLQLDVMDARVAYVSSVRETGASPAQAYNATAFEETRLREGDYVEGVNEVWGDTAAMITELKGARRLDLHMRRPLLFTRSVQRSPDERIGVQLNYSDTGTTLLVTGVTPGGATQRSAPDLAAGDRILAINGTRGGVETLLGILKSELRVELEISRYCEPTASVL